MTKYAKRIERVMTHIHDNLDGDLSLDALAEVAALSRFHFSRIFRGQTGEGVAEAVRRLRLNRAAILVATSAEPIDRLAQRFGYATRRSFERAFRNGFGLTPHQARASGKVPMALLPKETGEISMFDVVTRTDPSFSVAALAHRGPYTQIGDTFARLFQTLGAASGGAGPSVAFYYDDPGETPVEELRAHAGLTLPAGREIPAGLDAVEVPSGRYAVLLYKGAYDGLPEAWQYMYAKHLPNAGVEIGQSAPFERYLTNPMTTRPAENLTEICVPIA